MSCFAALDVSQAMTAICVGNETGCIQAEKKVPTCPDSITDFLAHSAPGLVRVGMETGPLASCFGTNCWSGSAHHLH